MIEATFRVTMLGTGTGIPVPERGYAGILVEVAGESWVFDAGPGTLKQLVRAGITYQTLDRLFLTHLHLDHSLDLASMLFAMHIPAPQRTKPFWVYGPPGVRQFHEGLRAIYPGQLDAQHYALTVDELPVGTHVVHGVTVQVIPMHHSLTAHGYRLTHAGQSIAYAGDTGGCPEVIELGREADLFMLECSVRDEQAIDTHLTPSACGRIAAKARCKQLVLTHFYPVFQDYDILARVRQHYTGPTHLATDLQAFQL